MTEWLRVKTDDGRTRTLRLCASPDDRFMVGVRVDTAGADTETVEAISRAAIVRSEPMVEDLRYGGLRMVDDR